MQALQFDFSPRNPCKDRTEKNELIHSCPLISTCILWHALMYLHHIHKVMYIFKETKPSDERQIKSSFRSSIIIIVIITRKSNFVISFPLKFWSVDHFSLLNVAVIDYWPFLLQPNLLSVFCVSNLLFSFP